jgi:hypothetical protein
MSEGTRILLELGTPARRVELVEHVRNGLRERGNLEGRELRADLPLSGPSEVWLKRMRAALCDVDVSQKALDELKTVFSDYQEGLPEEESAELERRVQEFDAVKTLILRFDEVTR